MSFIQGDILDVALVNQVVTGHDGIVHLAAQTGVAGSLADPRRDCEVDVIGTLNVLGAVQAKQERTANSKLPIRDSKLQIRNGFLRIADVGCRIADLGFDQSGEYSWIRKSWSSGPRRSRCESSSL